MADGQITMNPGTGGDVLDTTLIGGTKHRERIHIAGAGATDLAPVDATYGLTVDVARVPGGTLNNGVETSVGTSATQIVAATAGRRKLIVQNNGAAAVRVGTTGVTATTGLRLAAGGSVVFDAPHCPTNAIYAISESGSNAVLAQEIT